ncbi:chemotaxis protein histidine kinase-like protein [Xenococcus sp. PCC 7305]|uniref:hybrid sensor histidine kinase/response regulator n=1 Tax=Xenococcus sp. PCC 7305 TaxID=102125 RepID=UPI0002AC3B7E|nr:hybrid sensor histidine kinase/response regulator [Xenococcus sp. PCC 7305]ELS03788.1 chemotaxis protein histidine kinase-like protein [Xenococcus sp. PCC 7305]
MVSDFRPRESYQFFLQEAVELLQVLETGILELRANNSTQHINTLMRTAHSIKGGAACVGLNHIKEIAYDFEHVFKILYQDSIEVDSELEELLLRAFDCLKSPLIAEIKTGSSDAQADVAKSKPVFQQLETKLNSFPRANKSGTEIPFAQEIKRGLERLETILSSSEKTEILEALKAQLTIFRGLAKISNIDEFVAIANNTLDQLDKYPASVVNLGKQALMDFRIAYQEITHKHITKSTKGQHPLDTGTLILPSENLPRVGSAFSTATEEIFASQLNGKTQPKITPAPPSQPEPQITPPQPTAQDKQNIASLPLGIRMDVSRVELMLNLVGELVTQDNRFLLHNQQNGETLVALTQWYNRFKQLNQHLKLWVDRLPNDIRQTERRIGDRITDFSGNNNSPNQYLKTSFQTVMEELAQLGEGLQDLALLDRGFQKILKTRQKTIRKLQKNLLEASMLPIGELINQFPRIVRDIAFKRNKQVKLEIYGERTLVDKAVVEKLYDPLVHLVLNAIAHGIESPNVRQGLHKSTQGIVTISVYHQGNHTYIQVKDDGKGIDWEHIRKSLIEREILSRREIYNLDTSQLAEFLFDSGFSTADEVSTISGRGMGLSAVKRQIKSLQGTIAVSSEVNIGTSFTICLPLTLTIVKLLVFSIAGNLLAIPVDSLVSIVLANKQDIKGQEDQQFYRWQDQDIAICPEALLTSYRYPRTLDPSKPLLGKDWQSSHKIPLLLLSNGKDILALEIEQILMEQDLVIKPFDMAIAPPASLIGCTVLGDGRLIPVLNSPALVDKWLHYSVADFVMPEALTIPSLPTIMIVDDSLTIRQTLSAALRKSGYRVIQCRDGLEGIEQLKQETSIQAAISDIEMPRMNGLEFLSRARQLRGDDFPVIMLTSRISDKYRQLAQNIGATRYLSKPFVEREVLRNLEECLLEVL